MTELMKRYEAETGNEVQSDAFAQHEIWEYIRWLESQLTEQTLEKFQEIIRNQCDEISALKDQLRWRPVSEKPNVDCQCFVSLADGGMVIIGMWKNGELCIEEKYRWLDVKSWLPIPPQGE